MGHAEVQAAIVRARPDTRAGEQRLEALVVPSGQAAEGLQERLLSLCRRRLAPYKVPDTIEMARALPTNPSGKLHRASGEGPPLRA